MKKTVKLIAMSLFTLVLCTSLIVGATFALFTSESNVSVAVTSGKVEVAATVAIEGAWSAQYNAATKEYDRQPATEDAGVFTFANTGTAAVEDGKVILTNITPGDGVKVRLTIANNSNVAIKYKVTFASQNDTGLLAALQTKWAADADGSAYDLDWKQATAGAAIDPVYLDVELPVTAGNEYSGVGVELEIRVLAVQGNARACDEDGDHLFVDGKCFYCGVSEVFVSHGELDSASDKYVISGLIDESFVSTDGTVVIPGSINGHEVVIDEMAFGSENRGANETITSVVIEEGVTQIGQRAFQNCTNLTSVTLPDSLIYLGADPRDGSYRSDYLKIFAGCTSLREVKLGSQLQVIGNQAFADCTSLQSIELPASLKSIHTSAFLGSGLQSITIPASVEMIQTSAFKGCTALSSVIFEGNTVQASKGSSSLGKGISSSLFEGCTSLRTIDLPDDIDFIDSSAFKGCSALESIEIPANVVEIKDYAFQNCNNLGSITFADGSKLETIGNSVFYCGGNGKPANDKLKSIVLPEGLTTIGSRAFGYCSALESIEIPANVVEIKDYAFQNCNHLGSVTFADGSKLQTIGDEVFSCSTGKPVNDKLRFIILPEGLTTLGGKVFDNCTALEIVVIPSTVTYLGSKFDSFTQNSAKFKVYFNGDSSAWDAIGHDKDLGLDGKVVYFSTEYSEGCWHWQDGAPTMW